MRVRSFLRVLGVFLKSGCPSGCPRPTGCKRQRRASFCEGPPFVKLRRCVRYALADLEAFVQDAVRRSTSDAATPRARRRWNPNGALAGAPGTDAPHSYGGCRLPFPTQREVVERLHGAHIRRGQTLSVCRTTEEIRPRFVRAPSRSTDRPSAAAGISSSTRSAQKTGVRKLRALRLCLRTSSR
jgi:hypothetical protein